MKTRLLIILVILFWTLPLLAQEFDTAWVKHYYEGSNRKDLSRDVAEQSEFEAKRKGEIELFKERRFERDLFERHGDPSMRGEKRPFHPTEPFSLTPEDFPVEWRLPIHQPAGGFGDLQGETGPQIILDDFLVNDDTTGGCDQYSPAIARSPSGNFVITWTDERSYAWDIYAQRYDSSGTPLGSEFKVNDVGTGLQHSPAISMDSSGNFVITWEDFSIYAQRYDSSGTPLGSNFKVNDAGTATPSDPAIAMDGSGNFVITWDDERNGNPDIYAQRYDFSGTPLGSNFKVNDDAGTADQYFSAISMDGSGNFVITWTDERNYDDRDIYGQRYDSSGAPLGSNFKVNDDVGTWQVLSATSMDDSGNFVITWQDGRNENYDIYAQRYDTSGIPLGSNFKVNDDTDSADQFVPAIASDAEGNFVIVWNDDRNGNPDIYAQRYDSSGTPLGSNFKVNDDAGTANQHSPAISMDGSGNFVITWGDERNGVANDDIYAQRYDSSGTPLGSNFKMNDAGTANQYSPAISTGGSGNFVITWEDERNGNLDIYAQRYDSSGTPLGSNFKVNDDAGTARQFYPAISMGRSGNFVITWKDERNGVADDDIYAQRYDSSGTPLGSNFKVNDDAGTFEHGYPAISMGGSGNFVITWRDERNGDRDIYAQRYDSSGTPLGSNFKVNDDLGTTSQRSPAMAMDGSDNFVITWFDYRNGNYDIYAQRYDSSGTPLGSNFKVNDDAGSSIQTAPAIAMDGLGNFVITWNDWRNGNIDIYAQRYNSSGSPIDSNYMVSNPLYASFSQISPAVAANDCNIYFAWRDDRRAKGWDVYANIKASYHPPDPFSLLSPWNKKFIPAVVHFDWEDAIDPCPSDEVRYDLYVIKVSVLPPDTTIDSNLVASECVKALEPGIYCWTVKARDNWGAERWSNQTRHFIVTGLRPFLGDLNGDGSINGADVVFLINYLYKSGTPPDPLESADVNCDGVVNAGDVVFLINYLFKNGPLPSC